MVMPPARGRTGVARGRTHFRVPLCVRGEGMTLEGPRVLAQSPLGLGQVSLPPRTSGPSVGLEVAGRHLAQVWGVVGIPGGEMPPNMFPGVWERLAGPMLWVFLFCSFFFFIVFVFHRI